MSTPAITDTTYTEASTALDHASRAGNDGDFLGELTHLRTAAAAVEIATRTAVVTARANGATWDEVGRALGITRQGAYQRFGRD